MPSLKAIRVRIASVKSTQKITRAMKLVAAARLRRAQDAIVGARPYANALLEAIREVAGRAGTESHPLLDPRPHAEMHDEGRCADREYHAPDHGDPAGCRIARIQAFAKSSAESAKYVS